MIEGFFKTEKKAINEELEKFFNKLNKGEKEVLFADFNVQLKNFIIPENQKAKRIHPILLIAAFNGIINPMYLEDNINEIREVSIAVEFLHSGHLIHDDLIDDDDFRRDNPSFHKQLEKELLKIYKNVNKIEKNEKIPLYGRDLSILGGSLGYFLGLDVIRASKFPNQLKLLAIKEYSEALDFLIKGMIIEEYMEYHQITMTLEQYLNLAEMQRARIFEKSTKIGAILAKGNLQYQIKPLSDAMLKIGQAHAIRDDILDIEADIKDKKKKFLYILAIQNTNEEQQKILNEIYRKPEVNNDDLDTVKYIFAKTNAIIVAEQFSKNLIQEAKGYLKDIYPDLNREQKDFFNEFSDYIYLREF
ncbi:MAG: polyprenyl synthetase family protein [Candidatus Hermodarchaeota archaeon]